MREPAAATARLFIALWPSPPVQRALVAEQRRWRWPPGARPTARDKLHLTLHFIGAVPVERVPAIAAGLSAPRLPFALMLDTAEVWPNGCAVLAAGTTPPPLATLHARLAESLRLLRLSAESRAFRPHVTLARDARGAQPPEPTVPLRWPVRGHVLVQSANGRYTPVGELESRSG